MQFLKSRTLILFIWIAGFCALAPQSEPAYGQTVAGKRVSYQTTDGWTIIGTLFLPEAASRAAVPAVVILGEPEWVIRMIHGGHLAQGIVKNGMAALTIDIRGTGASFGKNDFEMFSPAEIDAMQLDIKGAVKFLSTQKNIDARRIGVVGATLTTNYMVQEAAENKSSIKALVLISAALSRKNRDYIESRRDLPIFAMVGKEDPKKQQARAAEPYFLSENNRSAIFFGIGNGAAMFDRPGHPIEQVSEWLKNNLISLGTETEVSFKSEDGWTLHGNLFMPDGLERNSKVPGVVFIHGIQHDQQTWYYLAQEVVQSGKAVLLFDWRGTRKSIRDDGKWEMGVDLPSQEQAKVYLDVKAAIQLMASQKQVDPNRIALVGATATNNHTVRAAIGDSRIKTIVGLSFYAPDPDVKSYLSTSDTPLLLVATNTDANADGGSLAEGTREVYRLSKSKLSQLLMYDNAGRGSDMLKVKPELNGIIVRWLNEKLSN